MCSDVVIRADKLSKCYQIYDEPHDRLKQTIWRGRKQFYRSFHALKETSVEIGSGEIVGIIGANGAGKTTLLQLISGTLTPSTGSVDVSGRVAPLLALGAGFNPDFSGRENVYLNAAILGLSHQEIEAAYDSIVDFSEIGDFIDQPVKTYSSGMYARLAFAVATSINPDILIVDEVLSVGDGAFSRKSFERIMSFREEGRTILFCSHSLYQVEALCSRVIWLDRGEVQLDAEPASVIKAYNDFLDKALPASQISKDNGQVSGRDKPLSVSTTGRRGVARITDIQVMVDGIKGSKLSVMSKHSNITIQVEFTSEFSCPAPTVALIFSNRNGQIISSTSTKLDQVNLLRNSEGEGKAKVTFPDFPLLRGDYWLDLYLMCEKGIKVYDLAKQVVEFNVTQDGLEQGLVSLPHSWQPG